MPRGPKTSGLKNMVDFKIVSVKTVGNITISANTQFNNIQADKVTVSENTTARLYGTIKDSLVLKKNSKVYLHGTIKGEVVNEGGELILFK